MTTIKIRIPSTSIFFDVVEGKDPTDSNKKAFLFSNLEPHKHLQNGDVLLSINGSDLTNAVSAEKAKDLLRLKSYDDTSTLEIRRHSLQNKLDELKEENRQLKKVKEEREELENDNISLGDSVNQLTDEVVTLIVSAVHGGRLWLVPSLGSCRVPPAYVYSPFEALIHRTVRSRYSLAIGS